MNEIFNFQDKYIICKKIKINEEYFQKIIMTFVVYQILKCKI